MKPEISASVMCANFYDMKNEIEILEKGGVEYLHIDIMDGCFVPNYTLGPGFIDNLRENTNIKFDIHLMVERPEDKIDFFKFKKGDLVSIHYESSAHIQRVLSKIKEKGAIPGIAINPATPLYVLEDILDDIDFVLIMTVNPGYAGQKLILHILDKIKKVRDFLDTNGYEDIKIQVDGNVSFENGKKMRDAGADIFVAGSSSIFKKDTEMGEAISILRNAIDR